jgi:hypothetical protein
MKSPPKNPFLKNLFLTTTFCLALTNGVKAQVEKLLPKTLETVPGRVVNLIAEPPTDTTKQKSAPVPTFPPGMNFVDMELFKILVNNTVSDDVPGRPNLKESPEVVIGSSILAAQVPIWNSYFNTEVAGSYSKTKYGSKHSSSLGLTGAVELAQLQSNKDLLEKRLEEMNGKSISEFFGLEDFKIKNGSLFFSLGDRELEIKIDLNSGDYFKQLFFSSLLAEIDKEVLNIEIDENILSFSINGVVSTYVISVNAEGEISVVQFFANKTYPVNVKDMIKY